MGWGEASFRPKSVRDPALEALMSSPERRVKKWKPKINRTPASTNRPVDSPPPRRPSNGSGAAKSIISEIKTAGFSLQPSLKAQLDHSATVMRAAKAFQEAGQLRRKHAAIALQRAERRRHARVGAATQLQHFERQRQRVARQRREVKELQRAEQALLSAPSIPKPPSLQQLASQTGAMLARELKSDESGSRSPLEIMFNHATRAIGSIPHLSFGGGDSTAALDAKLLEKVKIIRFVLDIPDSYPLQRIADNCPIPGSLEQRLEALYNQVQSKLVANNLKYSAGEISTLDDSIAA